MAVNDPTITVGMLVDALAFGQWSPAVGKVVKVLPSPTGEDMALVLMGDAQTHWVLLSQLRPTTQEATPRTWR